MTDSPVYPLTKQPANALYRSAAARDKMLDEIISEVGYLLVKQYDRNQVSEVLASLAGDYHDARITAFLPIVIHKQASALLAHANAAAASASANVAPASKMDFLRFEFKYVLSPELRARIEAGIGQFMVPDPFVAGREDPSYIVRSLYYDDPSFSCYYQKTDGSLMRSKFRLRTYSNTPQDGCTVFLETKGRYNSLVFKRRVGFDSTADFSNCASTTAEIARAVKDSPVAENFLFSLARHQIAPVILIEYVRRPYVAIHDPDFRLTLDERLYGTVTDRLFPAYYDIRRPLLPGRTVMEIKFRNSIPLWFHNIIRTHSLNRVSISKVCKGMEVCDLVKA